MKMARPRIGEGRSPAAASVVSSSASDREQIKNRAVKIFIDDAVCQRISIVNATNERADERQEMRKRTVWVFLLITKKRTTFDWISQDFESKTKSIESIVDRWSASDSYLKGKKCSASIDSIDGRVTSSNFTNRSEFITIVARWFVVLDGESIDVRHRMKLKVTPSPTPYFVLEWLTETSFSIVSSGVDPSSSSSAVRTTDGWLVMIGFNVLKHHKWAHSRCKSSHEPSLYL